ncbi:sugar ABC transporter ATP-binding protein [Streptomyces cynarae]|uniref:Sugar ABC transporter ATP-binding protein n=1 Tax=Streptomyces cynarae TaxID=2981134 RepID=A0ABY6EDV6_9ACTN|nr:sugar ABC transporter ATP-binding protein [Streptomyces cynarae]UXY24735.1 sugar ABC transporter ATP-binding protein [Streptomyces cynarae]
MASHDVPAFAANDSGAEPLLRIRGLGKRFGGTLALDSVDLDVQRGSVLALLGPNGAGKSTLIKVLAQIHRADEGEVTVGGHPLGTQAAARAMSFLHQDLGLVGWMTVAENIALGTGYPRRLGMISWRRARERCLEALEILAGHLDPDTRVADLGRAERSLVAIARALATRAPLIVLDEPTASLPATDCARLFDVLHALRDRGHGIVYVSHRLDEVYRVADRFAVLRDGRVVSRGRLADHPPARLVQDIVGHGPAVPDGPTTAPAHGPVVHPPTTAPAHGPVGPRPTTAPAHGPVVLRLEDVRTETAGPVSLQLRSGELLGMVGLTGAGHMALGRALAGSGTITSGRILLDGRPYHPRTVAAAVRAGVGFVTDDRQEEGCLHDLTVRENLLANPRAQGPRAPRWIVPRRERATALSLLDRYGVRPLDTEARIDTLSGGNQQRVMVGRWLGLGRRLLILEEPTAGIDVGAKAAIHRLLDEAPAAGAAVLLCSTDFEEVADVCHRALVFVGGTVAAELTGAALTVPELTRTASAVPGITGTATER